MIEPFEFETIRLQAPLPTGQTGQAILRGKGSVDEQEIKSFTTLKQGMDSMRLDAQQIRMYQTKIGNPSYINSHESNLVPERIISLGVLAPHAEEPTASTNTSMTTSQMLSKFLDHDMTFVPQTDLHHAPAMKVNSPETPYLNPGLTTVDSRKVQFNWI